MTTWTDTEYDLLRAQWAEGFSASQIAALLPGRSRNSVIGAAARLKLERRASGAWSSKRRLYKADGVTPRTVPARLHRGKKTGVRPGRSMHSSITGALRLTTTKEAAPPSLPTFAEDVDIPAAQRRTLVELERGMCRWPVGDPRAAGLFFCGAATHATYCATHAAKAGAGYGRRVTA